MSYRITTILQQLRQDVAHYLQPQAIEQACQQAGHRSRERKLGPVTTVYLFLLQILRGNVSCEHVTHFANKSFTDSSYCKARKRLPLKVLQKLLDWTRQAYRQATDGDGLWRGHRTFLIDGSSFSMPDTPELQAHFGQPGGQKPGCGFPVAHLMAMFDAATGLLSEAFAAPLRTHDMSLVPRLHAALRAGDVIVGDRGVCSYAHLALAVQQKLHAVFRVHQRQIVEFRSADAAGAKLSTSRSKSRWLRSLGLWDQVVEWVKPKRRPQWLTAEEYAALPERLMVRELRYRTGVRGFRTEEVTLVTTLLDAELYPLEELANLYGKRWRVEVDLRHLKQTMEMDILRCETVDGVEKELTMYALAYNLVRMMMVEAGRRQGVDVERISFVDTLRWLLESEPGAAMPRLKVNPDRRGRCAPRVVKRRPKPYPRMTKPRSELRKCLLEKEVAA
jgi:hypothetical protein